MQKLAEICIKRPVFAAMIILALVVVGASSYFKLGVDRFPAVDVPTVTVRASLPGASPEEAESTLAQTLEEAVNTVEGIEQLRSVSSQGRAFVSYFEELARLGGDANEAKNWVTNEVLATLNERKIGIGSFPLSAARLAEFLNEVRKAGWLPSARARSMPA